VLTRQHRVRADGAHARVVGHREPMSMSISSVCVVVERRVVLLVGSCPLKHALELPGRVRPDPGGYLYRDLEPPQASPCLPYWMSLVWHEEQQ
jgi:hypothetical protein